MQPFQEILGELGVLSVSHDRVMKRAVIGELSGRTAGQRRVAHVGVKRPALVGLELRGIAERHQVDGGSVLGSRDGSREKCAVVARIVPGESALVARVLPEGDGKLHRLERGLGVQGDRLAVRLDLLAAPRPEIGVPESRRVPERMRHRLADGKSLGLELLANLAPFLPRLWKRRDTDSIVKRLAVDDEIRRDRVGDGAPRSRDPAEGLGGRVVATLRLAYRLRDIADIDEALLVEMGPVVEHVDDVGACARRHRRRHARLDIIGVDALDRDLGAQDPRGLAHLTGQDLVARRDEVVPPEDMQRGALRMSGGSARGQNTGQAGSRAARRPHERSPVQDTRHGCVLPARLDG
jgi:hypothetical protein